VTTNLILNTVRFSLLTFFKRVICEFQAENMQRLTPKKRERDKKKFKRKTVGYDTTIRFIVKQHKCSGIAQLVERSTLMRKYIRDRCPVREKKKYSIFY
jgi:hypothetical protein